MLCSEQNPNAVPCSGSGPVNLISPASAAAVRGGVRVWLPPRPRCVFCLFGAPLLCGAPLPCGARRPLRGTSAGPPVRESGPIGHIPGRFGGPDPPLRPGNGNAGRKIMPNRPGLVRCDDRGRRIGPHCDASSRVRGELARIPPPRTSHPRRTGPHCAHWSTSATLSGRPARAMRLALPDPAAGHSKGRHPFPDGALVLRFNSARS